MSEILSATTAAPREPRRSLCDTNSETFPITSGKCAMFRCYFIAARNPCNRTLSGLSSRAWPVRRGNLRLPSHTENTVPTKAFAPCFKFPSSPVTRPAMSFLSTASLPDHGGTIVARAPGRPATIRTPPLEPATDPLCCRVIGAIASPFAHGLLVGRRGVWPLHLGALKKAISAGLSQPDLP